MQMVKLKKNGLSFTNIEVVAKVNLGSTAPNEKIGQIAQLAEKYCLVSGSLACPVQYHVEVAE